MYKLFCYGEFAGEFRTPEEVEKRKRELADEVRKKTEEDFSLLKEMEQELKNIFPKPESYSRQQYREFVKATYPRFFELLDKFIERRAGEEEVLDYFFSEPNGEYVGLKIKRENSARGYILRNLNTYYLYFYKQFPCNESFQVIEENE